MLNIPRAPRRALLRLLPSAALTLCGLVWLAATPLHAPASKAVVLPGADRAAEYPGGMEALAAYLGKAVTYPAGAPWQSMQGRVPGS